MAEYRGHTGYGPPIPPGGGNRGGHRGNNERGGGQNWHEKPGPIDGNTDEAEYEAWPIVRWSQTAFVFIFQIIWGIIAMFIFIPLVLIFALPFTFFRCCRPHKRNPRGHKVYRDAEGKYVPREERLKGVKGKTSRLEYNPFVKHSSHGRDIFAFPGYGPEKKVDRGWTTLRTFFVMRTWQLYEVSRELWRMVKRQGLQIVGVICAWYIITCQAWMMYHDYTSENVQKAEDDPDSLDPTKDQCAYVTGTGIANWGSLTEMKVWYGVYHGHLIFLSLMLIADEVFNVRMGLFAPQWSRQGTGYTIMFLATANMSTSPNWQPKQLFRFRYVINTMVFLGGGVYNVIRGWLAENELMSDKLVHRTYRLGRFPLRPWTEQEWFEQSDNPPFRRRARAVRRARRDQERRIKAAKDPKNKGQRIDTSYHPPEKPRYWTERVQLHLGDRSVQLERIHRDQWDWGEDHRAVQKVHRKMDEQTEVENGGVVRKFWLGYPTALPLDMRHDYTWQRDAARCSDYKDGAFFYGMHYWNPWSQIDNYPVTDVRKLPARYKAFYHRNHRKRYLTLFFDVRRWHSIACGISMFAVHVGLLVAEQNGLDYKPYEAQYDNAVTSWKANNGPSHDDCQYYKGSVVPILVQYGVGAYSGVRQTLFWITVWHLFLMGMCIAVVLVAISNCRYFGMHVSFPITLIGPRTSSISTGLTLGFLAFSTLQLGFFRDQPEILVWIVDAVCANCVVSWILHLFKNEYMKNVVCRMPFIRGLSFWAFEVMDGHMIHWEYPDYDLSGG